MKTIDFNKGIIAESQSSTNTEQINEFLGTILVGSIVAGYLAKHAMGWWSEMQADRKAMWENKTAALKAKQEYKANKAAEKEAKAKAKEAAKMAAFYKAQEKTLAGMPDGPAKDKLLDGLKASKAVWEGRATPAQVKTTQTASEQAALNPAQQKLLDRMVKLVHEKYGNDPEVQDMMKQFEENFNTNRNAFDNLTPEEQQKQIAAGAQGTEQTQGAQGGAQGAQGTEQTQGAQGGAQGAQGTEQTQGAQGGAQGTQGTEQTQGAQGAQGTEQTQGAQGGAQGAQGTPKPEGDPKPDEEWVDDDGTKYTKIGDKYTMTTKDGDTTELTQDEYENHIENDDVKDADRTDNDDDLEDNTDPTDISKDPRKKYKQRTYKRGNKTFKTKSYYDKKGNSLSKEAFKEMVQAWEERQKGKKRKNESRGFSFTPLMEVKTQPAVNESEIKPATDRIGITKERLVYIKYVMDTTTNSVEKVSMERMYNALFNINFNTDGTPRSLKELYTYLNQTMVENKGKIDGLPTESQIENIDKKVKAFQELHDSKYTAYMTRLEKELLDKAGKKGDDKAADLLHPAKDDSDAKTLEDIRQMSSLYGFTNILGLEPERKPNKADDEKKDEIDQQQKSGTTGIDAQDSADVNPDDISDEQIEKIIGVK